MALIKLTKANDTGTVVGVIFVNTDQILTVSLGQATTEIQMSDGRPRWVKETPEQVADLVKKG